MGEGITLLDAVHRVHEGDVRPFMEHFLFVTSKANALVPFRFNHLQDRMDRLSTGRDYFVKYRQGGSSLYNLGKLFTFMVCIPRFTAAAIGLSTDSGRSVARLFRNVEQFIETMPKEMQPRIDHHRERYIELADTKSQMFIGTVGSKEFGRSETYHALLVTELGSFTPEEAQNVLTSAVESVVPGGLIIFETTPKLMGSPAHLLYLDAKAGRKAYNAQFFPWWFAEDYFLEQGAPEALRGDQGVLTLSDEELRLSTKFLKDGVKVEDRIRWRRSKLAERGDDFFAEYPEDELSAWLAATQGVFPQKQLRAMMDELRQPIERDQDLRIYKEASDVRSYCIGIDAAGGIPGGDLAAGVVLCAETGEVVAILHGILGPEEFAKRLAELGKRYGSALIGGERDAWTLQTLQWLDRLGYPNLYYHDEGAKNDQIGFPNTHSSRLQAVAALREAIKQGDFRAYDEELVGELVRYQRVNRDSGLEAYGAPSGMHDDLCVAAQRAQQLRLTAPAGGSWGLRTGQQEELVISYPRRAWGA